MSLNSLHVLLFPYLRIVYLFFLLKVVGAKVVTNARSPGARCYGFVTMSTAEEATKCITHLHKTELHGKIISVEKVSGNSPKINKSTSAIGTYITEFLFYLGFFHTISGKK